MASEHAAVYSKGYAKSRVASVKCKHNVCPLVSWVLRTPLGHQEEDAQVPCICSVCIVVTHVLL